MIALIVSLRVKPDLRDQFLQAVEDNALCTVRDEPGCLRFDVLEDKAEENHFLFAELYQDDDAIEQHRQTPHYRRWQEHGVPCLIEGSRIITNCAAVFLRSATPRPRPRVADDAVL